MPTSLLHLKHLALISSISVTRGYLDFLDPMPIKGMGSVAVFANVHDTWHSVGSGLHFLNREVRTVKRHHQRVGPGVAGLIVADKGAGCHGCYLVVQEEVSLAH